MNWHIVPNEAACSLFSMQNTMPLFKDCQATSYPPDTWSVVHEVTCTGCVEAAVGETPFAMARVVRVEVADG